MFGCISHTNYDVGGGSYIKWRSSYTAGFLETKLPRFFKGRGLCIHNSIQGM